ncbi:MAG TPA: DUF1552 domain-containing protein [Polyangiaceae bacterium]
MTNVREKIRRPARFARRSFLHGALAGAVGLPWLETFSEKTANAAAPLPKRFIAMFSPNGTIYPRWVPSGTETSFTLSPILTPLAPHQSDLVVVAGVDQMGAGGDGHQNGMSGMLTGGGLLPGRFAGVGAPPAGWCESASVDQRLADVIGRGLPFRSLELGVQVGPADNWGRMVYRGRNRPLPPREDPARTFDDVFGAAVLDPAERERRATRRQSILDRVTGDITRLSGEVSAADKQRLDAHLSYLREVEDRLAAQSQGINACSVPARPATPSGPEAYGQTGDLQIDLLVLALACGQTRVATLQWSRSVSDIRFTWLGIDEGHHSLSHMPDTDTMAQDKLTRINTWYAERFASLIAKLKSYPEGNGTLFDQCLLLWCNELAKGNVHSRVDAPYVLAGSAGGALRTGRFLQYSGDVPHNNLLVSILNTLGVADTTFGRREWCTGPLTGFL